MLTFEKLQNSLLEHLRFRVRNGELTERGLARVTGISQPHVHNILKGVRTLTLEMGDEILRCLHLSLQDLLSDVPKPTSAGAQYPGYRYVSVLKGFIGPSHPWPREISRIDRFPLDDSRAANLVNPVAARVAEDVRMGEAFSASDMAILDQSFLTRSEIENDALYLVKAGDSGLIRRARLTPNALYIVTEDCLTRPPAWQRVSLLGTSVHQVIRARVLFAASENGWDAQVA